MPPQETPSEVATTPEVGAVTKACLTAAEAERAIASLCKLKICHFYINFAEQISLILLLAIILIMTVRYTDNTDKMDFISQLKQIKNTQLGVFINYYFVSGFLLTSELGSIRSLKKILSCLYSRGEL